MPAEPASTFDARSGPSRGALDAPRTSLDTPRISLDAPLPTRRRRPTRAGAILAVILICQLMVVLDMTIVNIALPDISGALALRGADLSWVLNAYALTFGGLLLLGARAGDLFGRRRIFLAGIALFTLASLAGGLASSGGFLLGARAVQGIGAALASPSALALLMLRFREGSERARALALYAAVTVGGSAVGLIAGGVLVEWTSWRWIFFVNLPIGAGLLVLARRVLPETPRRPGRVDIAGALTSTAGMAALVFGFVRAASDGWSDHGAQAAFVAGAALLAVFILIERRASMPITPLRLFADRDRSFSYLARLFLIGALFGMFYFLTQFLQDVLGYSALTAGLAFLPLTVGLFAASQLSARVLMPRVAGRWIMGGGLAISTAGVFLLSELSQHTGYPALLLSLVMFGVGNGLAFVPLTAASLAGVKQDDAGAASGLVNVMQQVGGALGLAVLVTVFSAGRRSTANATLAFVHGADHAFFAAAVLMAVAAVLVVSMRGRNRPQPAEVGATSDEAPAEDADSAPEPAAA